MKKTLTLVLLSLIITMNIYSQKKVNADKFYSFTKNYALVKKGMELRFIDTLGNIMPDMKVDQDFSSVFSFDYGIQGNDLYISNESFYQGIKNMKGEYVFPPKYKIELYNNYFILKTSSLSEKKELIIIDKNGKTIYKDRLIKDREVLPINSELIAIRNTSYYSENNLFEIKNINTGKTTGKMFSEVNSEFNGLIKVKKYIETEGAEKWGFLNTKFETVIDFIFSNKPGDLIEDRILVKSKENKYGFINSKGQLVIEPKYLEAYHFVDGKTIVKLHQKKFSSKTKTYNYGYRLIDLNDKVILDLEYMRLSKFNSKLNPIESDGIVRVEIKEKKKIRYKHCLLNIKSGKLIYTNYQKIYRFNSGLALVEFKDQNKKHTFGYINKKGKLILVKGLVSKF